MSTGNNIDGMKATDWPILKTSSIDKAAAVKISSLNAEQQQLVAVFTSIVKAAAEAVYGTSDDYKYKRIVDLVVKRLKAVDAESSKSISSELTAAIEEAQHTGDTSKVEQQMASLVKKLDKIDAASLKQCVVSALAEVQFDSRFEDRLSQKIVDGISASEANAQLQQKLDDIEQSFKDYAKKNTSYEAFDTKQSKDTAKSFFVQFDDKVKLISVKAQKQTGKITAALQFSGSKAKASSSARRFTRRIANAASRRLASKTKDKSKKAQKINANELVVDEVLLVLSKRMKQFSDALSKMLKQTTSTIKNLNGAVNTAIVKLLKQKVTIFRLKAEIQRLKNNNSGAKSNDSKADKAQEAADNAENYAKQQQSQQSESSQQTSSSSTASSDASKSGFAKKAGGAALAAAAAVGAVTAKIGNLIKNAVAPVLVITKKIANAVVKTASKPLLAILMSPAGMHAIGFIAGFVWTKWLKKLVMPIVSFVKKLSLSSWAKILAAGGVAVLGTMLFSTLGPLLLGGAGSLAALLPGIMAALPWVAAIGAIASGVVYMKGRLDDAAKARDEGIQKDNETTLKIVAQTKEVEAAAQEARKKLDEMQPGEERTAAVKKRLKDIQKAKEKFKRLEEDEKFAQKKYLELNDSIWSSADELASWKDRENKLREQKLELLKKTGLDAESMRDEANKYDKDHMTEEQRLARQLAEDEFKKTGQISDETYKLFVKASDQQKKLEQIEREAHKARIAADKEANSFFGGAATTYRLREKQRALEAEAQKIRQSIDASQASGKEVLMHSIQQSLQDKAQQQTSQAGDDGGEKIVEAVQQSSEDQKKANDQINSKLDEALKRMQQMSQSMQSINSTVDNSSVNNVTVVSAPAQYNMAQMESSSGRQSF